MVLTPSGIYRFRLANTAFVPSFTGEGSTASEFRIHKSAEAIQMFPRLRDLLRFRNVVQVTGDDMGSVALTSLVAAPAKIVAVSAQDESAGALAEFAQRAAASPIRSQFTRTWHSTTERGWLRSSCASSGRASWRPLSTTCRRHWSRAYCCSNRCSPSRAGGQLHHRALELGPLLPRGLPHGNRPERNRVDRRDDGRQRGARAQREGRDPRGHPSGAARRRASPSRCVRGLDGQQALAGGASRSGAGGPSRIRSAPPAVAVSAATARRDAPPGRTRGSVTALRSGRVRNASRLHRTAFAQVRRHPPHGRVRQPPRRTRPPGDVLLAGGPGAVLLVDAL